MSAAAGPSIHTVRRQLADRAIHRSPITSFWKLSSAAGGEARILARTVSKNVSRGVVKVLAQVVPV